MMTGLLSVEVELELVIPELEAVTVVLLVKTTVSVTSVTPVDELLSSLEGPGAGEMPGTRCEVG